MDETIAQLRARLESAVAVDAPARPDHMTVELLAQMYIAHCRKEFNGQHGQKECATVRHAFRPLLLLYADASPSELTSHRLRAARHLWIEEARARTTIQARMQRLRKAWRWARQVGLIETDLPDIGTLRYGHAPEPEPIKPVDLALVEATLPHVSPRARTLLKLMLYTGMRPGEACSMRADEIDTATRPWMYRPKHHKTAWKGCSREIYLGPKAQMLLQPILNRASAAASTPDANASATAGNVDRAGFTAHVLFTTARGHPWKPTSLYMAVFNACRKHDLEHWHPSQIRHSVATQLRREFGLEHAQAVLGHADIETTQIYAEKSSALASEAMLRIG